MHTTLTRARWAATGAAVAVSLGAGGLGLLHATAPDGASAYVPIVPCRLADTRPDSAVGPHAAPLGPDESVTYDGWGDVPGACDLPTGTTGLQLNVTAVGATELTNLRLYPTGQPTPTTSNLNPAPDQPPTPNAVAVTLDSSTGRFDVFNRFGNVHVVIDVLGYYTDHDHDDRYYTRDEVDAMLTDPPVTRVDLHFLDATTVSDNPWELDSRRRWHHEQNGATTGCLLFPVVVPAGTRLNTAVLHYEAPNAALVHARIVSLRRSTEAGGPPDEIITMINTSASIEGGAAPRSVALTHDRDEIPPGMASGPVPGPGYDTYFTLCTTHTVTLWSATLTYTPGILIGTPGIPPLTPIGG